MIEVLYLSFSKGTTLCGVKRHYVSLQPVLLNKVINNVHQCHEAYNIAGLNTNHLDGAETIQFVNIMHEARKLADNEGARETIDGSSYTGCGLAVALALYLSPLGLRGPLEHLIRVVLAAHSLAAESDEFLHPVLTIELGLVDRLRVHTEESSAGIHKHGATGRALAEIATFVLHVVR